MLFAPSLVTCVIGTMASGGYVGANVSVRVDFVELSVELVSSLAFAIPVKFDLESGKVVGVSCPPIAM
jgi:hypothetical protein